MKKFHKSYVFCAILLTALLLSACGPASGDSVERTPAEAAEMIGDYLQSQKPQLDPDLRLQVEELPMTEAWEQLRVQLFRITEGAFENESFLISGDSVLPMGTAVGGRGLTSLEIGDLDRDGSAELLFTYSFGSGIHQSRIGMYAPAYGKDRIIEAETGYLGDLGLFKEEMSAVGVRVVESDDATLTLRYLDTLGYLAIEQHNGQAELVLQVAEDLPDDVRQKLFDVIHRDPALPGPTETYTNADIGFAIDYPADWYARTGRYLILTSFEPAEVGQGGIPEDECSIDVLPPASPGMNQPLDEMVEEVKRDSEILWEENWILPGNVLAVRLQTRSEMSGQVAVLLTRINGTSLRVAGYGDLTLFDAIARTLRPASWTATNTNRPNEDSDL
jgi:hypothetical protein